MPNAPSRVPTERELDILQVLWANGPSTVRDVHIIMKATHGLAYTTVLTMLQVMTDKGLVTRDETRYPQHFAAVKTQEATQEVMTRDFIDRVFSGSALQLVQRALSATPPSEEELSQLEALVEARKGVDRDAS